MSKLYPFLGIIIVSLFFIGISPFFALGLTQQYWSFTSAHPSINGSSCGDHVCLPGKNPSFWLQYIQSHKPLKLQAVNSPQSLDIIAPDGTCNISGTLVNGGKCNVPQMVLSPSDYGMLQQNPAIMAVININPTQASPTTKICDIDNWIVIHEDGYFPLIANVTNLIDPPNCIPVPAPVPEFSGISFLVMGIAVMITISITALITKNKK